MSARRFRFGLFEFDAAARELRREGALVHLQPQPAQLLACLLANEGEVVSREDLRKTIWGTETFVDFERGLNFCVAQLRSALDDDSNSPRFVRTIPKRGYQFIAPVQRVGEDSAALSEPPLVRAGNARRRLLWACGAVILVGVATLGGYWARSLAVANRQPIVAVARFDNETADAAMTRFADDLTDNVVGELTRMGRSHYLVVGNASLLRVPRDQRDLNAIAASLGASYVVLGQVQSDGAQARILVHLIRLPDQTHLWVARLESAISDPLNVESDAAQRVGHDFSWRIIADSSGQRLPALPSR